MRALSLHRTPALLAAQLAAQQALPLPSLLKSKKGTTAPSEAGGVAFEHVLAQLLHRSLFLNGWIGLERDVLKTADLLNILFY